MEAIKLIGVSKNGKLTVDVPTELDNKELEIMIIASKPLESGNKSISDELNNASEDADSEMI